MLGHDREGNSVRAEASFVRREKQSLMIGQVNAYSSPWRVEMHPSAGEQLDLSGVGCDSKFRTKGIQTKKGGANG